ncbi:MAG: flagellar protein FlgN [Firmicutes bacterium]|nr:flagellar protein FlgN [Bacillota bacterium]
MDTRQQFAKLYKLLQRQEQVIERLIAAAEEQTQYLRRNDTKNLQTITEKQEVLSNTLKNLENDRLQVQQALEKDLGLPGESSLEHLTLYAGQKDALDLNNIKSSLQKNTEHLKEVNILNQALTDQALQFTNFMLGLLQPQQQTGYTKQGNLNKTPTNKSRLNKSI